MKGEVDKLDTNKLVNFVNSLNNLKTKVDKLDVCELKTVPIDLKKLSEEWSCKKHKTQHLENKSKYIR